MSFGQEIVRQIRETLGPAITAVLPEDPQPTYAMQYFTEDREVGGLDPRQHAIGLTFCIRLDGSPQPAGEALDFCWFDIDQLPTADSFGFNQDRLVTECLRRLNDSASKSTGVAR